MDKVSKLDRTVDYVKSGQTLALGGMTIYRRPVAFVRALIQKSAPPRDLTLVAFTAGLASDMLVGARLVSTVRTCYFGLESFGMAPMFLDAVAKGRLKIIEESEASLAAGLRASMAGVGFMPSIAWRGTDMFRVRPDVKRIADPYTQEELTAFPAIPLDVAVIHVLQADRMGNGVLGGNPTVDVEIATVAMHTILTAEEVVEQCQGIIDINGSLVDAVVHLPGGAWPTSCYPLYNLDGFAILAYLEACARGDFLAHVNALEPPRDLVNNG